MQCSRASPPPDHAFRDGRRTILPCRRARAHDFVLNAVRFGREMRRLKADPNEPHFAACGSIPGGSSAATTRGRSTKARRSRRGTKGHRSARRGRDLAQPLASCGTERAALPRGKVIYSSRTRGSALLLRAATSKATLYSGAGASFGQGRLVAGGARTGGAGRAGSRRPARLPAPIRNDSHTRCRCSEFLLWQRQNLKASTKS